MTEISFHFNVPDRLAYGCRLIRKAYARGACMTVVGPDALLGELDESLWQFSATEFLPHGIQPAGSAPMADTPIVLLGSATASPHHHLLINFGAVVPEGFERFERLIELVTAEPSDRKAARVRWKHYVDRGYALQKHDLAVTKESA
jgi:DNA polymerase III subunit chi